ncbi:MAG: hypothetical protein V1822_00675 [Candidatus Micrarchaeota archaeon]
MAKFTNGKFIAGEEEALSLMQAGFGKKAGDEVILHPLEAAYLRSIDLLEAAEGAKKLDAAQIVKKMKAQNGPKGEKLPTPSEQFAIFSQLRSGGRVVRFNSHSPHYWRVYARGVGREQERAQILLRLVAGEWKASISSLELEIAVARQLREELVLAFVQKGQPSFVKVNKFNLD